MKQIKFLSKLALLFAVVGFIASCETEVLIDNPTVDLVDEAGFVSTATTVNAGDVFTVKLSADQGSDEMTSLTIRKDGSNLSTDLFTIDGAVDNNPKLLFDGDKAGFTYEIAITTEGSGTSTYSFLVNSDDTGSNSTSVEITIDDVQVDPVLGNEVTGVSIFNNAGPSFGAIDLATGTNVSSGNADADLLDLGNDVNGNWRQQITGNGTTVMRAIDASLTYASITTVEGLQSAYDNGSDLLETGTLSVGSTYAAESGGKIYLFTITSVNPTSADNEDFLEVSIKSE